MADIYTRTQGTASRLLGKFAQGTVTLTRSTPGTPDPETPWEPAEPTTVSYTLSATVKGVSSEYVDGTVILATDLEVTAAVLATDENGAEVSIDPDMSTDALSIDGQAVTIVRDVSVPAAGTEVALRWIVRG